MGTCQSIWDAYVTAAYAIAPMSPAEHSTDNPGLAVVQAAGLHQHLTSCKEPSDLTNAGTIRLLPDRAIAWVMTFCRQQGSWSMSCYSLSTALIYWFCSMT